MPRNEGGLDWTRYRVVRREVREEYNRVVGGHRFVLNCDTDPHARAALKFYADRVEDDNPQLALEIRQFLIETGDY